MSGPIEPGRRVRVAVPATSANLGPGFDSLGLALGWADEVSVEVIERGVEIEVTGEGAATLPRDESHLVVRTAADALAGWGRRVPGWRLVAHNTIPHGRGLGSSSAALVSGLALAWALGHPGRELDRDWAVEAAARLEGHADNVAPAVLGGFVLTWAESGLVRAVRGRVHPDVAAVAFVPPRFVATERARASLPASVPHADAAANAGRAALLVHALGQAPELLPDATRDWLHQPFRRDLMPESLELVDALRGRGLGAFVSGAGPTVLVLLPRSRRAELDALGAAASGFERRDLEIGEGARILA